MEEKDFDPRLVIFDGENLDADEVYPNLFVGSYPAGHEATLHEKFDVLVLCARGLQPPPSFFDPGLIIGRVILHDPRTYIHPDDKPLAENAGRQVAGWLRDGKRVLVTCQAGLNRSGMVAALAIHFATGAFGGDAVRKVQECRGGSLFNPGFCNFVREFGRLQR